MMQRVGNYPKSYLHRVLRIHHWQNPKEIVLNRLVSVHFKGKISDWNVAKAAPGDDSWWFYGFFHSADFVSFAGSVVDSRDFAFGKPNLWRRIRRLKTVLVSSPCRRAVSMFKKQWNTWQEKGQKNIICLRFCCQFYLRDWFFQIRKKPLSLSHKGKQFPSTGLWVQNIWGTTGFMTCQPTFSPVGKEVFRQANSPMTPRYWYGHSRDVAV